MRKSIRAGTLDDFRKLTNIYRLNGRSFTTIKYGSIGKIRIEGLEREYVFFDELNTGITTLAAAIVRDIKKYEAEHKAPDIEFQSAIVEVNCKALDSMGDEKHFRAIDFTACYWNIAYKNGFISKKTYEKGLIDKDSRLIALGSLNKTIYEQEYKDGVRSGNSMRKSEYSAYWNAILKEVERLYVRILDIIGMDNYIGWETDCLYVKKQAVKVIQDWLTEQQIEFRSYACHLVEYTPGGDFKFILSNCPGGKDKVLFTARSPKHRALRGIKYSEEIS